VVLLLIIRLFWKRDGSSDPWLKVQNTTQYLHYKVLDVYSQSDMIDLCRGSLVDLDMVKRQSTAFIQSTMALLESQVRFVLDKGNECNECNRKITTNVNLHRAIGKNHRRREFASVGLYDYLGSTCETKY
jgi:hypothetical protein